MSDEKQENFNGVTTRRNNCKIKDTILDPEIWFNELSNLNLKFKNINAKHEKDKDELRTNFFDVLPEEYKQVRVY